MKGLSETSTIRSPAFAVNRAKSFRELTRPTGKMVARAKAILFDLGETLVTQNIEDNMVTRNALREISSLLPKPLAPERFFELYHEGYKINEATRSRHHVEIPIQVWMRQLLERVIEDNPSQQLVSRAIKIIVKARAANAVAFDDAHPTLKRLSERDIGLGIISNVSSHEVAMGILDHVGLTKYFDKYITSASIGIRKPDPGIFRYALMQFKVSPEEAVIVGDSEIHDVGGGYVAGLKTVLIDRRNRVENSLADYRFNSLREAATVLESLQLSQSATSPQPLTVTRKGVRETFRTGTTL
jgi:HAD superfamily hydrolase (TIGR01549 family)